MNILPEEIDVTVDRQITGETQGTIAIRAGATLVHSGTHNGSINVESSGALIIHGTHKGSLHVETSGLVTVEGDQMGSVHVEEGGTFAIARSGRHAGSVHNLGTYINEGVRGGTVFGVQPEDRAGGRERRPDKTVDGVTYYSWEARR